jgi:hypothetical protein
MPDPDLSSPDAVEHAFYRAFETIDLALMAALWLDDDSVRCVHPGGDLLSGRDAVLDSWRGILAGAERPMVRYRVLHRRQHGELAVHLVEERIGPAGADPRTGLNRLLATNIYQRTGQGWRMVLHHGSLPLGSGRDGADGARKSPRPRLH